MLIMGTGQVLDGTVLMLAVILNPSARRRRAEGAGADVIADEDTSPRWVSLLPNRHAKRSHAHFSPTIHVGTIDDDIKDDEKEVDEVRV